MNPNQVQIRLYNYLSTDFLADTQVEYLQNLFRFWQLDSFADLLKRPTSLNSAADHAHVEVLLLGGQAREGEWGLPQGAGHQQTLRGRHRHH